MKRSVLSFLAILAAAPLFAAESDAPPREQTDVPAVERPVPREAPFASRPLRSTRPDGFEEPARGHAALVDYALDVPWGNPAFERFRAGYLSEGGKAWLEAVARRSDPYADFIRERIRSYGLPDELFFLPFIESEYSPWVVSRSGAAGMWQFMKNSISGYGMRVDDWIDERRDFWKATDGALRKLRDNHAALGSWELALAAYNAGLGAVTRAAKKGGTNDYYELCAKGLLKRETANYVPKFMAVVSVAMYAGRHGLSTPWREAVRWELVPLAKPVDVGMLADAAALKPEVLKAGNAELQYNVTPPDGAYALKVPEAHAEAVKAALTRGDIALMRFYLHKVKSGDTLSALSKHYEVTVAMIQKYNKGLRPELLRIGQTVVIPALKDKKPYVSAASLNAPAFTDTYVVAKGDTLWSLSLRYRVQPEVLAERNGLRLDSVLREGARLSVPALR